VHDYELDPFRWAAQVPSIKPLSHFASLHPYFRVHPGTLEGFTATFPAFVEKTASEERIYSMRSPSTSTKCSAARATSTPRAFSLSWDSVSVMLAGRRWLT
jgi:hypothetical protein